MTKKAKKTLHAIWVNDRFNPVTEVIEPAHAEAWQYTTGSRRGIFVGPLEGWAEKDCGTFYREME